MDRFLAIEAFVRVAETQSFAQAARQMRCSRSVVTTRVQQLESFVGAPLFHRNTRSVRLSELGQAFLRDCVELVGRTNDVVDQMREVTTAPSGRLRVHALPGFVLGHLAHVLQQFQGEYPQIVLDVSVNDGSSDPVKDGCDCALQMFAPGSIEVVARRLFPVRRVFCATPEYLRRNGRPREPQELLAHRVGWYSGYPGRERLAFHGALGTVHLQLEPVLLTNSVHLLREYALEDAGLVCLPTLVASDAILDRRLLIVLPDYPLGSFWLSAFFPSALRSALKLRLFLDLLERSFAGTPPWDSVLIERRLLSSQIVEEARAAGPSG